MFSAFRHVASRSKEAAMNRMAASKAVNGESLPAPSHAKKGASRLEAYARPPAPVSLPIGHIRQQRIGDQSAVIQPGKRDTDHVLVTI